VLRKFSFLSSMHVKCLCAFCHGCLVQELCRHYKFIHPSAVKITEYLIADSEGFIVVVNKIRLQMYKHILYFRV